MVRFLARPFGAIKRWVRRHPRFFRGMLVGLTVIAGLTLVFQLLYPRGRALPSVQVQGVSVGGQTTGAIKNTLAAAYGNADIQIVAGQKTISDTLANSGMSIDLTASAAAAADFSWYQRIIPFSSIAIMLGRDTAPIVRYDSARLRDFAAAVSAQAYAPAVNANVAIQSGKAELVQAQDSQEFPEVAVLQSLRSAKYGPHARVTLKAVHKPAERSNDDVKQFLSDADEVASHSLTLELDDEKVKVENTTVSTWLKVAETGNGGLELGVDSAAIKQYVEQQLQPKVYKSPGTTNIKIVDGREASRATGASGQQLDVNKSLELIRAALKPGAERTFKLSIVQAAPKTEYARSESNSNTALYNLLKNIVAADGDFAISVIQIGGSGASVNGDKQYTAASTYKLFVAYAVFKEIEAGNMKWTDTIWGGKSVATCFNDMIVVSDNNCPKAFGEHIGWAKINTMMKSVGLTNTRVEGGNHATCASDLALFLYKLQDGSLVSSADRTRLLDAMKQQIYRSGIPAGTGVAVANKVGFLDALLHDAGIVYGPKGPYVLVVMSSGGSWNEIANAAAQIHDLLN